MDSSLRWPDYLILVSFLAISLGIGLYHAFTGGRQRTTTEFLMANRNLKVLPTTVSLVVSFQSAVMMLGTTNEMYSYGSQYFLMSTVFLIAGMIVSERFLVPWLYPLRLISVNEYFERRFASKAVRILASICNIISGILYMGSVMYAPSAALESVTGFPINISIPLMAVVSVAYTALGGMRAVIWTDVFQCLVMLGGMLAVMIKGFVVVGGFDKTMELCRVGGRLNWVNWNLDPRERHTFWGFTIGWTTIWISRYGLNQASVQRFSATGTLSKARQTILWNVPAYILLNSIACFTGLTIFAYYFNKGCDPMRNKEISNANQLLPYFVSEMFNQAPGFAGLFLSTLYGGALSSVSSSLSGAAANCWEDVLKWQFSGCTESRKTLFNKALVVMFGFLATGVAFLAAVVPGPVTQVWLTMYGSVSGPLVGLFLLGGFSKYANWKGALIGGIGTLFITFWLNIGSLSQTKSSLLPPVPVTGCSSRNLSNHSWTDINNWSFATFQTEGILNSTIPLLKVKSLQGADNFYSLSYLWYTPLVAVLTLVFGMAASLAFRDKKLESLVDECLLIPFRHCLKWDYTSGMEGSDGNAPGMDGCNNEQNNNTEGLVKILLNSAAGEEISWNSPSADVTIAHRLEHFKQTKHSSTYWMAE